jgi:excisionase family DNA binding protein
LHTLPVFTGNGYETLGRGAGVETYLSIAEMAAHIKLSEQTIRRYVLNREIPYHKIKKVVRFRLSEIERWIDNGGGDVSFDLDDERQGVLFDGEETGEPEGTGADGEACCPPAANSLGVCCANSSKEKA